MVRDGELILFVEWLCEWGERVEGRRQKSGVSYSPPGQTWHVSTPVWLSRSPLWLNTLSIRSRTCMPTGSHSGVRSSQSHILLLLLLNWVVELGSSGCGLHFLYMESEDKHGIYDGFSMFWGGRVDMWWERGL